MNRAAPEHVLRAAAAPERLKLVQKRLQSLAKEL